MRGEFNENKAEGKEKVNEIGEVKRQRAERSDEEREDKRYEFVIFD
jgi:hypothetical protein